MKFFPYPHTSFSVLEADIHLNLSSNTLNLSETPDKSDDANRELQHPAEFDEYYRTYFKRKN
jgi:hypothetical protein